MFIDKLSKKEKIGLSISLLFVFLALFDRLVVNPINSRIQQINQEAKLSEKQLIMSLKNVSQKELVSREYQKYTPYLKKVGGDEEESALILSEIEDLARKSSISLANVKPQMPRNVDFYKEYSIEIEAEGQMDSITSFLYKLNTSPQLLRVEKLRLTSKEKEGALVKASFLITKIVVP